MFKRLHLLAQYLAPQKALSNLAGWLSENRWTWFKNWQISYLIKRYGVDIEAAMSSDIAEYPTFNSFFTRKLKPELRPIDQHPASIASPADGIVSQAGYIKEHLLFQAKGFYFTLSNLLGGSEIWAKAFHNGCFATIYLSPKDYHRVHMPIRGTLKETLFIPGKLFSVNTSTAKAVPNLFARNERLVCIFETQAGPMAIILVGAMLVASINTVWQAPIKANTITQQFFPTTGPQAITLEKGEELGHFKMGSTVIMLFAQHQMTWASTMQEQALVQMGQSLGVLANIN
jgi:phosphatidylserine decarboxylase